MFDTIRITGKNTVSGVYEIRMNFNDSKTWPITGSYATVNAQACLQKLGTVTSSRLTSELANALGSWKFELNDNPNLPYFDGSDYVAGPLFRDCFESARENGYKVHVIVARYTNEVIPQFIEFVFAGSMNPNEYTVGHRVTPPTGRRFETIGMSATPAERLDVKLSEIDWQQSEVTTSRPTWAAVVSEPSSGWLGWWGVTPAKFTELVIEGDTVDGTPAREFTKNLGYGTHPFSINPDIDGIRDDVGVGIFPAGNRHVSLPIVIQKLCSVCDVAWDGVLVSGIEFRDYIFNNDLNVNVDNGVIDASQFFLNWQAAFGFNWRNGLPFRSPITLDGDMTVREALREFAAMLFCRIDVSGSYDSEGRPYIRFVPIGSSSGTFPSLPECPNPTEDVFITDADGVRVTRRGFKGAVISPSFATNPIDIEIPFGTHMIAYETTPAFDRSRCTLNSQLDFKEQWRCGHRSSLNHEGIEDDGSNINPDCWPVGGLLLKYQSSLGLQHFPESHDSGDYDGDSETVYHPNGWQGYYPIQAVYERPAEELTEEERRIRQQNPLIPYALKYARYIRGERRQLYKRFIGVVAPNWADIQTGQEHIFTPLDTPITYGACEFERDLDLNEIAVKFEEVNAVEIELSYKIEGESSEGNGSVGGQGTSGSGDSNFSDTLAKFVTEDDRNSGISQRDAIGLQWTGFLDGVKDFLRFWQNISGTLYNVFRITSRGTVETNAQTTGDLMRLMYQDSTKFVVLNNRADFPGIKVTSASTASGDDDHTLTTKDYVDAKGRTRTVDYATSNVTLDESYDILIMDANGANKTVFLPPAADFDEWVFTVKFINPGGLYTLTIEPDGAETIDNAANLVFSNHLLPVEFVSDGTEWWIISGQ